jgi:hypothetical protein
VATPSIATKPTVFISSTVRDFSDLRGALKFWLEESGCEVWLSEYNDADKDPAAGAFDACFDAVRRASFYVLLIGDRRGSLYSESDQVSVTQQEYRVAYKAFQEKGHPVPILFARAAVKNQIDAWLRSGRTGEAPFPDAPFVAPFLSEVTREPESTAAIKGTGAHPLANWLYQFVDLRDIIDALRFGLALRVDIPMQRVYASLQLDLEVTLAPFVGKTRVPGSLTVQWMNDLLSTIPEAIREQVAAAIKGTSFDFPMPGHWYMQSIVDGNPLSISRRTAVKLTPEQITRLGMYLLGGIVAPEQIWLSGMRQAVSSGLLLQYEPQSKSLQDTELSRAVVESLQEFEVYKGRYQSAEEARTQVLASTMQSKQRG